MKFFRAAPIVAIALAGCSNQQFTHFMDHPILSWAPFTQADIDRLNPLSEVRSADHYPDQRCRTIADQRTEYRDQYAESNITDIYIRIYRTCLEDEKKYGH